MADLWNLIGSRTGSWNVGGIGLPEFGLTEQQALATSGGKTTDLSNALAQNYSQPVPGLSTLPASSINLPKQQSSNPTNPTPVQNNSSQSGAKPNPYTTYIGGTKLADLIGEGKYDEWGRPITSGGGGGPDPSQQIRNEISGAYDSYLGYLDNMLGDLPNQQANYEGIARNSYNQGVTDLNAQKAINMTDLNAQRTKNEQTQAKNLADLTDNIRNQMTAGSLLLGTRGVSSPSAQRMYSYALTKEGNKSRAGVLSQSRDIESQIADREAKLNTTVTQEMARLGTERDNKIMEAANWLQQAQQQIKQMKAQGLLNKGIDLANLSKELLNQATQRAQYAQTQFDNYRNSLVSWAESNAKNIGELRNNMNAIGSYQMPGYSFNPVAGMPSFDSAGNLYSPFGYGSTGTDDWRKKLGLA